MELMVSGKGESLRAGMAILTLGNTHPSTNSKPLLKLHSIAGQTKSVGTFPKEIYGVMIAHYCVITYDMLSHFELVVYYFLLVRHRQKSPHWKEHTSLLLMVLTS
jgi:hypothetical protein